MDKKIFDAIDKLHPKNMILDGNIRLKQLEAVF
jgi:hypothetical protein